MLLGSILLALAWAALQGEFTLVNLVVECGLEDASFRELVLRATRAR